MDDLPFALWLGMIPTVRVESKGSGGGCSSPCDSVGVSTALSPPLLEQEFQQEGRDLQVYPEDSGRSGPQVGTILFPVLLPSLLNPVQAAHLLVPGFSIPPPFSCKYPCSPTCGFLSTQAQSLTCRWHERRENQGRVCPVHSF